nr:hypothetical protein IPEBKFLO_00093 [Cydia pomonella granulovirus]WOZ30509.1 hypothetical protein AGHAAFNI_00095 [Cydia pomonella granulovirus]WOZ30641.1 hypothetical protein KFGOHAPD_00099 [Cydia pomonella granulovirus]WOZ45280.1 hypothetical protein IFEMGEHL_00096 [Cydia pomonella granulovirus]WOZ45414.1 hypothetical protein JEDKAPMP_00102 [Cydia pomonella granulovirus]
MNNYSDDAYGSDTEAVLLEYEPIATTITGECTICRNTYQQSDNECCFVSTSCRHVICMMCAFRMASRQREVECPFCRQPVAQWNAYTRDTTIAVRFHHKTPRVQTAERNYNEFVGAIRNAAGEPMEAEQESPANEPAADYNSMMDDMINNMEQEKREFSEMIISLQRDRDALQQDNDALRSSNQNVNEMLESLRQCKAEMEQQFEQEKQQFEQEKQQFEQEKQSLNASLGTLQSQVDDLQKQLQELSESSTTINNSLMGTNQELKNKLKITQIDLANSAKSKMALILDKKELEARLMSKSQVSQDTQTEDDITKSVANDTVDDTIMRDDSLMVANDTPSRKSYKILKRRYLNLKQEFISHQYIVKSLTDSLRRATKKPIKY